MDIEELAAQVWLISNDWHGNSTDLESLYIVANRFVNAYKRLRKGGV